MPRNRYKARSEVWLYPGQTPWHFVTLPERQSEVIKKTFGARAKGWGSLPVKVTIGTTSWRTSIFPDKKSGTYLLPLKSEVRKKEHIYRGDSIWYVIEVQS
ncbi:MAG: protein of unknown function DUF1905 [Parcubacteria group bacterium Gr01-1014_72]|nr:MAG: protein of unknown function DUF1905 [Parcubacteria group bacterium Gr01-1014_72]